MRCRLITWRIVDPPTVSGMDRYIESVHEFNPFTRTGNLSSEMKKAMHDADLPISSDHNVSVTMEFIRG